VAIGNALQLEAARANPALCRFNYDAEPIHCRIIAFSLLIHYFTVWSWPLTLRPWSLFFDLEHLRRVACDVLKLYIKCGTQSSNPRRSYCDFNAWLFDLVHCVTCCAWIWDNCHQVWPSTTYPCLNYGVFDAGTLCRAVTLTFDLLTLKVRRTSSVTR